MDDSPLAPLNCPFRQRHAQWLWFNYMAAPQTANKKWQSAGKKLCDWPTKGMGKMYTSNQIKLCETKNAWQNGHFSGLCHPCSAEKNIENKKWNTDIPKYINKMSNPLFKNVFSFCFTFYIFWTWLSFNFFNLY